MRLKDIQALDDSALISSLYWVAVRMTNEVNSRRGLTKATAKEEEWILNEVEKRFNVSIKEKIIDR